MLRYREVDVMHKICECLKLYIHYVSMNIKCMMQYKTSFLLTAIGQFLVSFNVFLGVFFMFRRFNEVEGFSYSEVLLCFSVILLEFSVAEMFARGFDTFPSMVKEGGFDRVLVRPRNEILQVLGSKFELTRIGRMLQAVVIFVYGIMQSDVQWDIFKIITVFFMVIGGTAVFAGLFLIYAALCFFTLDGLEFMNVFTDGTREFGKYPVGIYGKKMLLFTTFFVPYALVQYYPLLYIIGHRTGIMYVLLPLLACWFIVPALMLWSFGVRHYKSCGS